jgi:cephalosporin hydroxylase
VDLEGAMNLRDEVQRLCATPSDIQNHLPRFVALVTILDAKHVIELGSRSGVSTVAWLYGLAGTGGRLTSVDLDEAPNIGQHDHWTHIQGSDLDPDIIDQLDMADIVFIDTSHLYEHTVQELNIYRHLVRSGGVLVLHDTMLPTPEGAPPRPLYPVRVAIEEFVAENGYVWHNYPDSWGLAVIKVV